MRLQQAKSCDVLVVGSGIAGIMAAIRAAEQGCSVVLVSSGPVFSGSSFYPGTWGLGLIGPENEADQEDLVQSILQVGCGMADETMVRTFVAGIHPAIERVKAMGIRLKTAVDQNQKDFIPCFDRKHRDWNGLLFDSVREVCQRKMQQNQIETMPYCELLQLVSKNQRIAGAVVRQKEQGIQLLGCKALVLATGGYGGLFERRLTTDDVCGVGQWLALEQGCSLVNMEFMQMMPGYLAPCYKTIFNEKTFRYTKLTDAEGKDILAPFADAQALLEARSGHGPFTSRLISRQVDLAMVEAEKRTQQGVTVTYRPEMKQNMPEFVKTYFDWLWEKKHITPDDSIQMAMFAHAANGGICIQPNAQTEVEGLFACGEVTGGMHGADRIGGLSTANGLVFGTKAGESAAQFAAQCAENDVAEISFEGWGIEQADTLRSKMRQIMTQNAMVVRQGSALQNAIDELQAMIQTCKRYDTEDAEQIASGRRLWAQMHLAQAILRAELLRTESRGSHYRADYPQTENGLQKRILIRMKQGKAVPYFEQKA